MADQFKLGDVVQLKSGGPKMTVTEVGNDISQKPRVWCEWFNEKNQKISDDFTPESLKHSGV